jgi:hypothetical protein
LLDYGLEGYGLYWYCLELIVGKIECENLTFELEHDARIIARNTGSTPQKVQEMMRHFVDLGLFENNEGTITCFRLAKRLDQSMTSNPRMRALIEGIKNHDGIMTQSCKKRIDKIRTEEKKEDIKPSQKPKVVCPHNEILNLWDEIMPKGLIRHNPKLWKNNPGYNNLKQRWEEMKKYERQDGKVGYETQTEGLEFWKHIFIHLTSLTWMMEEWKPSLAAILTKKNFYKAIDGEFK